ncbi:MAG TPA: methyltransferase domain-containing protein [Bryobacteraceae bacterium]|nr:methyltransferase domain-containing protein [Bryobacteraceae bacterium]
MTKATTSIKAYKGIGMEGFLAKWYATNTGKGMEDFRALAQRVSEELAPASKVLEIAPGPGYFSIELAKRGAFPITGLDISRTFVELARARAAQERVSVDFRQGNASAMPFADGTFDYTLCRAAFKNFSEPVKAIEEMYRVLKPGGRAVIIDLKKDASVKEINAYIDAAGVGWFNAWIMKVTFRGMLLKRAYTRAQFDEMISRTRFRNVSVVTSGIGFEITLTK